MSRPPFLTASWEHLIMANYGVDPDLLRPYLPAGTELDEWNGKYYVSLVGFLFNKVRIKGIPVPFHTRFPEVNLRFYVRRKENDSWKRGVVFISEIVPLPAISFVANTLYQEHYATRRMKYKRKEDAGKLFVSYQWKHNSQWNEIAVQANTTAVPMPAGSQEEFITEHYWGYSAMTKGRTGEYQVDHPRWRVHQVESYRIDCDFKALYGAKFEWLVDEKPDSVLLAEGSPVTVYGKRIISDFSERPGHVI